MRSVIYTDDMEAVTVIDLPAEVHHFRWEHGDIINVPVWETEYKRFNATEPLMSGCVVVTIHIEKLMKDGRRYPLFIVKDHQIEDALRLVPVALPGQARMHDDAFRKGFVKGFINALRKMMDE